MSATPNVPRKRPRTQPRRNVFPGLKWCPHCSRFRVRSDFGFDRNRDDGLSGWCRDCRASNAKERREATPIGEKVAFKARYNAAPEKWKAKVAVARAVAKGLLSKPTRCPACDRARRIEAHHHLGYERRHWLHVVWRCRQCHKLEHTRPGSHQDVA